MTAISPQLTPAARKAEIDEDALRRLLEVALRDWRFGQLCHEDGVANAAARVASLFTDAIRAVVLWSLLVIAYALAGLFGVGVLTYVIATLVAFAFARPLARGRRTSSLEMWPFSTDISRAELFAWPLWFVAIVAGLVVLLLDGSRHAAQVYGLATLVATATAALYATGRTVANILKGRAPRVESGMALVVPIGILVLFGPLFSAEMWAVADDLRWWPGLMIAPLALGPLVFFLFRQLRGSIASAFTRTGGELAKASDQDVVDELVKLLRQEERKLELSGPVRKLLENAFLAETIERRAASIGRVMEGSFGLPLLIGLLPVVLGVAALMTAFMYVLAWIAIDVRVAGAWLAPSAVAPPPVDTVTPLHLPWGPYPIIAAVLGIIAAAVFLAYALTDESYRGLLANSAINVPARRCLLLGIPYRYLAAKHDHWDEALPIRGDRGSVDDDNRFATHDQHDAGHADRGAGHSLWYSWIADTDLRFGLQAVSDAFSPLVAVYEKGDGTRPLAVSEVAGRPACFAATGGSEYRIAVDGLRSRSDETPGPFTLAWAPAPAPPNDQRAGAIELPAAGLELSGTTEYASKPEDEPDHADVGGGASVWYRWTAPDAGWIAIRARSDTITPLLGVYVAAGDTIDPVATLVRFGFDSVMLEPSKGTEYLIAVDAAGGAWGGFQIVWEPASPPPNNAFADAIALSPDVGGRIDGDNTNATREDGEPAHAGRSGGRSIWYSWTPDRPCVVAFSTLGSAFDTLLAVYTGDAVNALAEVVSNDDVVGSTTSRVQFQAAAGETYRVAVDGYGGSMGSVMLSWEPGPEPPSNDSFAVPAPVDREPGSLSGTSVAATKEAGEPQHAGNRGGSSVWYAWEAPREGWVAFDTLGSTFDTLLAVYTGDAIDALTVVAANDDADQIRGPSRVRFRAEAGETYRIAVDGWNGESGSIALAWHWATRAEAFPSTIGSRVRGMLRRGR